MYDAFREKRHNCSIERFRQAVREQNIGFTTLSGEGCYARNAQYISSTCIKTTAIQRQSQQLMWTNVGLATTIRNT